MIVLLVAFGVQDWLSLWIKSRLIVVLGVEKECLEAKRFAFEPSILDVVVRRCIVHQFLDRSFRFVTVQDGLDILISLAWADLSFRHVLLLLELFF